MTFSGVAVLPAMVVAHKFLMQIELVSCKLLFHMMHRILGSLRVSTHSNYKFT